MFRSDLSRPVDEAPRRISHYGAKTLTSEETRKVVRRCLPIAHFAFRLCSTTRIRRVRMLRQASDIHRAMAGICPWRSHLFVAGRRASVKPHGRTGWQSGTRPLRVALPGAHCLAPPRSCGEGRPSLMCPATRGVTVSGFRITSASRTPSPSLHAPTKSWPRGDCRLPLPPSLDACKKLYAHIDILCA